MKTETFENAFNVDGVEVSSIAVSEAVTYRSLFGSNSCWILFTDCIVIMDFELRNQSE